MSRRLVFLFVLILASAVTSLAQPPTSGALLVWIGEGTAPEARVANSASQLAALLPNGSLTTLIEFDAQTIGVQRCTSQPFSADGRRFAFFASQPAAGADRGTLYQMTDLGAPQTIGVTHTMTCALDNFGYSPDGERLAYIDFQTFSDTLENVTGTLRVLKAETLAEQGRFERAVAFMLTNDELMYLQFFPNADGAVDEIAISVWDGTVSREVSAITARSGCRFSGGSLSPVGADLIGVLVGENCRGGDGRTRWQLYLIDRTVQSATLLLSAAQDGGYFPASQTYNLYTTLDGTQAVISYADGITRDTAAIAHIDLSAPDAAVPVVSRAASMRRYVPLRFSLPTVAPAARSWDDRYWAVGVNPPGSAELAVIDLGAIDAPIRIPINRAGDAVRAMAFSPDSTTLVFVAGGTGGADTSLYHLDLELGVENRIARGQYAPALAVRADKATALVQYRMTSEAVPRPYTDIVLVDADGAQRDLFGGIVLNADGFLQGFRFAVPLAWR